jgi:hypothetical protein
MVLVRKSVQRFVPGMTTDVRIDYHWASLL